MNSSGPTALDRWTATQEKARAAAYSGSPYDSAYARAENIRRMNEAEREAWLALPQSERDAVNAEREEAAAIARAARMAHAAKVATALRAYRAANSPNEVPLPRDYMSAEQLDRIADRCRALSGGAPSSWSGAA